MSVKSLLLTMANYNANINQQMWASIKHLTPEQYVATETYSRGSIRKQVLHMAAAEIRWLAGFRQDPEQEKFSPSAQEYGTMAAAEALLQESNQDMINFIDGLTEERLNQPAMPGMNVPLAAAYLHVLNHGTDHRAQVFRLLEDAGAPTFNQDFIFYLLEQAPS